MEKRNYIFCVFSGEFCCPAKKLKSRDKLDWRLYKLNYKRGEGLFPPYENYLLFLRELKVQVTLLDIQFISHLTATNHKVAISTAIAT